MPSPPRHQLGVVPPIIHAHECKQGMGAPWRGAHSGLERPLLGWQPPVPATEVPQLLGGVAVGHARWVPPLPTPSPALLGPSQGRARWWGHQVWGGGTPLLPPAHPLPTHSPALCPCPPLWGVWPESVVSEGPQTRGGGVWGCVGGPQPIRSLMVRRDARWQGQLCLWVGAGAEGEPHT